MPRMRTLKEAYTWVKETDPDSALSFCALRTLVLSGEIPHVTIGAKRLVNLDAVEAYLSGALNEPQPLPQNQNGIRRIEV